MNDKARSGLRARGAVAMWMLAILLLAGLSACGGGTGAETQGGAASVGSTPTTMSTADLLAKASEANTRELAAAALEGEKATGSGAALPAPQMVSKVSARTPAYRFFNSLTGAHFYTISASERDTVKATLPQFHFEGPAFYVSPLTDVGLSPVYRFYNVQTGVHFYSISADEKATIEATLPQFHYEGIAYYASKTALAGMVPLYRFYVTTKGFHFYTANAAEKDDIRATLPQYSFENVGYYVMNTAVEQFTVAGQLSGLDAGKTVLLQNNLGDDLRLTANGGFAFPKLVNRGGAYSVTVKTQPLGQTCTVQSGSGLAPQLIPGDVMVLCRPSAYVIGGSVMGLGAGKTLVLRNATWSENLTVGPAAGGAAAFQFVGEVLEGSTYTVSVQTQPVGQTCTVTNGSGTALAAVSNVGVACTDNAYSIGGSVSGLVAGNTLILQNNAGNDLVRLVNGVFSFSTAVVHGSSYAVTVKTQPVGQTCVVNSGNGVLLGPVSNVAVNCTVNTYSVGGSVSGLGAGKTMVLQNNAGNDLTRSANGAFSFTTAVAHGSSYAVTVKTQPVGQTCSVTNGSGTVAGAVANVAVSCATNTYTVGGNVLGLGAGKTLVLQNNAGNDLTRTVNGNFVFSTAIAYGSSYVVSVKTQPVDQTCSVGSGMGTVTGQVSNLAVSCVDHVTVGGALLGLISGNPVVLTLNAGGDLSLNGNGGFTFATKTPLGAAYVVGVKTQPRGQTCTVSKASGTANAAVGNVGVSCTNNALTNLVISEVGGCPYSNSGCWLEVYNPTASAQNLNNYQLRAGYNSPAPVFNLPNTSIAPGEYRILAGNANSEAPVTALNSVVMVGGSTGVPTWTYYSGLVELVSVSTNSTVDAVRFGEAYAPQPLTAEKWTGVPVVLSNFVGGATDQPRSLVRPSATMGSQDTNSALDWVAVDFATPGGPNDVAPGAVDADNDGLPDANELAGTTYNGMDLYSMGARVNQRDIFVEVDHMDSSKAGVIPQQTSMQMVKDAFALHGFALHIDVGNLFAPSFDPANFNLGQGDGTVPYQACVGFYVGNCASNTSTTYRTVYDWKWQHFNPRRRGVFHYALFGDTEAGGSGVWGRGELFGNDFVVTMGSITSASSFAVNQQVNTFMHELGHNLGLQHGGDEDVNYKPNYLSVMNYLTNGISPGNSFWPFMDWKQLFGNAYTCAPACSATAVPFTVDYSDGSGLPLNEGALYESANVGRGALPGVYADWDENESLTTTPISKDLNADGVLGVLTDHNDWVAVTPPFARYSQGDLFRKSARIGTARKAAKVPETGATVPNPLLSDRGPTVITCGLGQPKALVGGANLRSKAKPQPAVKNPIGR